jgi:hypothetical protein
MHENKTSPCVCDSFFITDSIYRKEYISLLFSYMGSIENEKYEGG